MDNITRWIAGVSAVASVIGVYFAMPGFLRYLADKRKEKRQNRVSRVLLDCGPTYEGDFMFRCQQMSQNELKKALDEMERAGILTSFVDGIGRRMWMFTKRPGDIGSKRN